MHDGTADMADYEPKYRCENVLNSWRHGDNHATVGMLKARLWNVTLARYHCWNLRREDEQPLHTT